MRLLRQFMVERCSQVAIQPGQGPEQLLIQGLGAMATVRTQPWPGVSPSCLDLLACVSPLSCVGTGFLMKAENLWKMSLPAVLDSLYLGARLGKL